MPVMLERWNDDKMDALDAKVERIDLELREHRRDTKVGFESLHRTLIQTTVAVFTALVIGFTALFGVIVTQL